MTKELIAKLRDTASKGVSVWGDLLIEAADTLEAQETKVALQKGLIDGLLIVKREISNERDALQARVVEQAERLTNQIRYLDEIANQRDSLAAELAALKSQEPVAYLCEREDGHFDVLTDKACKQCFPVFASPVPPVRETQAIQQRATELVEKSYMPWDEAERLALSEFGITDADIAELKGNCCHSTVLIGDDIPELIRSVLVHGAGLLIRNVDSTKESTK